MATLKDVKTGKKEILPSTAKDKNGKNVTLIYFEKDGKLGFYVQKTQKERGVGKCVSGIAGGAVGAVGGAVGGGLTGGATFC